MNALFPDVTPRISENKGQAVALRSRRTKQQLLASSWSSEYLSSLLSIFQMNSPSLPAMKKIGVPITPIMAAFAGDKKTGADEKGGCP